jgi:hypothetical protein
MTDYERASAVYAGFIRQFEAIDVLISFPKTLLDVLGSSALRVRGDMDKVFLFFYNKVVAKLKKGKITYSVEKISDNYKRGVLDDYSDKIEQDRF